jgi:hypothetical protein
VPGARGPQVKPGLAAPPITAWKIDRERYRAVPFYSDGKPGPVIEIIPSPLFVSGDEWRGSV